MHHGTMTISALELTDSGHARVAAWLASIEPDLPVLPVVADLLDELLPLAQAGEPLRYRLPPGVPGAGAEIELELADVELIGEAH